LSETQNAYEVSTFFSFAREPKCSLRLAVRIVSFRILDTGSIPIDQEFPCSTSEDEENQMGLRGGTSSRRCPRSFETDEMYLFKFVYLEVDGRSQLCYVSRDVFTGQQILVTVAMNGDALMRMIVLLKCAFNSGAWNTTLRP
jgi:hypothetical protein